ncbi:insulin-like peptide receptor isoform X2 [Oppia nitens]|uniref:insulin-like peptide receptor isoform X2 n=1 Tax=Oppia nitens TaxID=1686743 RepID=UPI0023DA55DE|nr:insulin-like peptide receptor isoform X2 [Oppia nitens]
MKQLRRLGFSQQLVHIKGGVRIESVPKLCIYNTQDFWTLGKAVPKHSDTGRHNNSWSQLPDFNVSINQHNDDDNKNQVLHIRWDAAAAAAADDDNNLTATTKQQVDNYIISVNEIVDYSTDLQMHTTVCNGSASVSGSASALVLPPNETIICQLQSDDQRAVQQVIYYFVGHKVESMDQFLGRIQSHVYRKGGVTYDVNTENTNYPTYDPPIYRIRGQNYRDVGVKTVGYKHLAGGYDMDVRHMTTYYVVVKACYNHHHHHRQPNHCEDVAHQKISSKPKASADNIIDNTVEHRVNGNTVTIKWDEPVKPNVAIRSYQIQYLEFNNGTNVENGTFCLDYWQYLRNGRSFTITNLIYGEEYSFRLRTNSLNGWSKWSNDHYFNVSGDFSVTTDPTFITKDTDPGPVVYITVGLTILLILFVLMAALCYLKAPKKSNSQLDIISVNPEYEKFIVDPDWEVSSKDLKTFDILGDGAFGRVYYGELRRNSKLIPCAVKTLNTQNKSVQQRDNFLKEANIMKSFVDCHHIVKLIGVVSVENPVLVLMEYMPNGDLKTYLRRNRPDSDENPNPRVPTFARIFQMAVEIADGMSYLAAHKFVHRDLAARNCMVAEDLTVKIGDFGMTRDIYDNDYYRKRDCCLQPVRWMSPEALKDGVFTTYSDIWAYGVVLYEIVTLGAQPYQGLTNDNVLHAVIKGFRLPEPEKCPKKLWRIMQFCFKKHPKARPSFSEITEYLLPNANQSFREVCYFLTRAAAAAAATASNKSHEPFKRFLYSLIPANRLMLNDLNPKQHQHRHHHHHQQQQHNDWSSDDNNQQQQQYNPIGGGTQYCPMSPMFSDNDPSIHEPNCDCYEHNTAATAPTAPQSVVVNNNSNGRTIGDQSAKVVAIRNAKNVAAVVVVDNIGIIDDNDADDRQLDVKSASIISMSDQLTERCKNIITNRFHQQYKESGVDTTNTTTTTTLNTQTSITTTDDNNDTTDDDEDEEEEEEEDDDDSDDSDSNLQAMIVEDSCQPSSPPAPPPPQHPSSDRNRRLISYVN